MCRRGNDHFFSSVVEKEIIFSVVFFLEKKKKQFTKIDDVYIKKTVMIAWHILPPFNYFPTTDFVIINHLGDYYYFFFSRHFIMCQLYKTYSQKKTATAFFLFILYFVKRFFLIIGYVGDSFYRRAHEALQFNRCWCGRLRIYFIKSDDRWFKCILPYFIKYRGSYLCFS